MIFVDTHTHLFLPEFENDRDETVLRAIKNGVKYMFVPNIDTTSVRPMVELCEKFPENCYPLIGLHPESVRDDFNDKIKILEEITDKTRFYGIGETGLDYYWDVTFKEQQILSFIKHIELAIKLSLPLIIHVRNSAGDVLEILKNNYHDGLIGIFHCFSGDIKYAREIIELGFYPGIGGVVTFKKNNLTDVVKEIALENIVLETDSPYLAPVPFRGKRNESSNIPLIASAIAGLKNISAEKVAEVTTGNALKIFNMTM